MGLAVSQEQVEYQNLQSITSDVNDILFVYRMVHFNPHNPSLSFESVSCFVAFVVFVLVFLGALSPTTASPFSSSFALSFPISFFSVVPSSQKLTLLTISPKVWPWMVASSISFALGWRDPSEACTTKLEQVHVIKGSRITFSKRTGPPWASSVSFRQVGDLCESLCISEWNVDHAVVCECGDRGNNRRLLSTA